ncbi:MAG: transposase family protein [Planctomycetaceae bacterium]|nr:transposase family protein [Planctomycetaceae bacterium]
MERWHRALTKNDAEFKQLFGVKKEVFHEMLSVVTVAREARLRKGGRRPKLSAGDQLFLTLQYWREYRTMEHLAFDFGVAKSTVSDTITLVENALVQDGSFRLPGKKALLSPENAGRTLAVDVTESPVERPKKNKKSGIPGRKSDIR